MGKNVRTIKKELPSKLFDKDRSDRGEGSKMVVRRGVAFPKDFDDELNELVDYLGIKRAKFMRVACELLLDDVKALIEKHKEG